MRYYSRLPILLLVVGLVASLWTAGRRILVERQARTVEMTVDLEQLRQVALSTGVPLAEALDALRKAGVTSAAVEERSLEKLCEDSLAVVQHAGPGLPPGVTVVGIPDRALYRQVSEALRMKLRSATSSPGVQAETDPLSPPRQVRIVGPEGEELTIPAGWSAVQTYGVGLSPQDVALVRRHGLDVVGRISSFPAADDAAIAETVHQLKAVGARTVIFSGDEVLGHRSRIKQTAAALDAEGVHYGAVEFGKQLGDEELSRALEARIVRVHAIPGAEMARMTPDAVVDRFVKAAEERNIRLLYLRLIPYVSDRPFQDNIDCITAIADGLRSRGFRLGKAQPIARVYSQTHPALGALLGPPVDEAGRGGFAARLLSRIVPALSSLAVAAAFVLLLAGLVWLPVRTQTLLALLAGGLCGLMVLGGGNLGRELVALAGAMLFPVLAFVWYPVALDEPPAVRRTGAREAGGPEARTERGVRSAGRFPQYSPLRSRRPSPFVQFALMSLVSLMGALTVVGLLSERQFMVKVAAFLGIKAAHSLPLLAIALFYAMGAFGGPRPWPEVRRRAEQKLGRLFSAELKMWHVLAGGVAIVVIALLLARTGNDPGVGVSGTELTLRNMLDRFLVRPRTKEFLIGHPALLATLLLTARRRWRAPFIPFAVVGAIGQVSMVNSFCHLHTPLLMTVARTFNGLWLGVLIGLAAAKLIDRWLQTDRAGEPEVDETIAAPAAPAARAASSR